ncbi:hypothetical protein OHU11_30020 [Streptomyces sp. NBC_00257]|uniref:hypothetical protein n=1 Tax=unclassified Streptomyces TaxID=2593676 RepID=UPI00225023B8|nr:MULTISPECIES: hypothetical protein [unclassified Streptomyces]MCX5431889.1 hypothetical protein [Streptomyces sp. NBC_00062]
MRYTYRCDACRLTWDARDDIYEAKADRKQHMHRAHEGARPDDQIIETPGPLDQLGSAAWACVSSAVRLIARGAVRGLQSKGFREAQQTEAVRQASMLLGGGILILMLINWLTR